MKRLIVNADDFGMAEPVNLGIVKGHREGIVTSASLLACGTRAEQAALLARENPTLGVGAHLCLTIERSVLAPSALPTLTDGGRLPASPFHLMSRLALGLIDKREIEAELRAQIERALALGITPTHIDGHQHVHMLPGVSPIALRLALEYHIPAIRLPVGPWTEKMGLGRSLEKFFLEHFALARKKQLDAARLKYPDYFFGLARTGRLGTKSLLGIIRRLPEGTSEVMCHPGIRDDALASGRGWGYGWETELRAVTDESVMCAIREDGVELVSFARLYPASPSSY